MSVRYAWYMLVLLTTINLVNYVDRKIIYLLRPFIQDDLQLTYTGFGWLITALNLVYALASIPFGILADHWIRRKIIALGVLFWSAATLLSGRATNFASLLAARAAVGIGEAAYAPPANSLLSDVFPVNQRARILGLFNVGLFVGAATGVIVGGPLGERVGWRSCFYLVSLPGFLLAGLAWILHEPTRFTVQKNVSLRTLVSLFRNRLLMFVCAGGVITAFSAGALILWIPNFVIDIWHYSPGEASIYIGSVAVTGGLLGVIAGSYLADWLYMRWPWGRMATIGVGLILSSPFVILSLYAPGRLSLMLCFFLGIFFMVWYMGPIIAVIHDAVPSEVRATAQGLYIFLIHLFGDTPSPAMIGWLADHVGLQMALLPLAFLNVLGGAIFLLGCREMIQAISLRQETGSGAVQDLPRTGTLGL